MAKARFAEGLKILTTIAPIAFTTSAKVGDPCDLAQTQWATFLVALGAMTSDSTDTVTITVECSTGTSTASTDIAIAFNYRLTAAVGTDEHGAITAATSAGVALNAATHDNMTLVIDVDPAAIPAQDEDAKYIRVVATPSTHVASGVVCMTALLEPRYPGNASPDVT